MNQNEREGQSSGRTTGATGNQAEQQDRTIEGQESEPGKVWQEGDKAQYTGQGDTRVGGSDPGHGKDPADAGIRGGFDETRNVATDAGDPADRPENEQLNETQWQGDRFGQGGAGDQGGGSKI